MYQTLKPASVRAMAHGYQQRRFEQLVADAPETVQEALKRSGVAEAFDLAAAAAVDGDLAVQADAAAVAQELMGGEYEVSAHEPVFAQLVPLAPAVARQKLRRVGDATPCEDILAAAARREAAASTPAALARGAGGMRRACELRGGHLPWLG